METEEWAPPSGLRAADTRFIQAEHRSGSHDTRPIPDRCVLCFHRERERERADA
jgi:hypothetical protein